MAVKDIRFDVFLKSTDRHMVMQKPVVYTNDRNAVRLNFDIKDMEERELTSASAEVLLYMRDGSFFQISDVTRTGTTFSYVLKENQGKHSGTAQTQLVVKIGSSEPATPLFEFVIQAGLDGKVATEVMIQDWTTLTREAREFIAEMKANEDIRVGGEETRKSAESERISNEEGRVTAEETRVNQEEARVSAEVLRMEQFQDMQLTQDLDTGKSYKTTLEIFNGMPRLKLEEVTHG